MSEVTDRIATSLSAHAIAGMPSQLSPAMARALADVLREFDRRDRMASVFLAQARQERRVARWYMAAGAACFLAALGVVAWGA